MNLKLTVTALVCLMLSACNNNSGSEETGNGEKKKPSAFSAQKDALKKAEAVEQLLQDSVDQRDEAMREKGI